MFVAYISVESRAVKIHKYTAERMSGESHVSDMSITSGLRLLMSRDAFLFTILWQVKTARFKVGSDLLLLLVSLVLGESNTAGF